MSGTDTPAATDGLSLQMKGYRLSTAEILYHMPDHPGLLQSFIWQHYDIAPKYPELHRFLDFWVENIDGPLHSVRVARYDLVTPGDTRFTDAWMQIH
ncbi:MAG: usg protein [Alphaproteobacteria bacterium]|nr:usg protein [Alphaproteobacteria bacterium]MEC9265833.1 usg protein [Pseudomonadota bacterium]